MSAQSVVEAAHEVGRESVGSRLADAPVRTGDLPAETPIATRWGKGALGSEMVALECPDASALERAVEALSQRFRRAWVDLARGIAVLMAPSRAHDRTSHGADHLVLALAACKSIPVEAFGGGHWDATSGDGSTEPDESYYVGEVALAYRRLRRRYHAGEIGEEALEAFEEAHPATLVVEVEHTHYAGHKRELCRRVGMVELWEFGTSRARHVPAIVDLLAPEGPREREASGLIPGVRPENLRQALVVLEEVGGLEGVSRGLERGDERPKRLMRAAGMEV